MRPDKAGPWYRHDGTVANVVQASPYDETLYYRDIHGDSCRVTSTHPDDWLGKVPTFAMWMEAQAQPTGK